MAVPQISLKTIEANGGRFPDTMAAEIRRHGCVVIRDVIPEQEARDYKHQIQAYLNNHPNQVEGFPKHDPQVWELYWSKSQVAARSHAGFEKATLALNTLWHASEHTAIDLTKNLGYCDRLRIRKPGDSLFALQEHVDSGSLERWQDPEYRQCYTDIFHGEWEKYDPFDATHRVEARMDYYNSPGGCSAFRNFQGWVAISDIKTGSGTLRVCPLLKEATALFLMKPLTEDYIDKLDYVGAYPGLAQGIDKQDYPQIVDNMVSMPDVKPGDAVFWHCDLVHSVESKHEGQVDSSVLYIPSVPLCRINSEYLKQQRDAFIKGLTPPDFPGNHFEQHFEDRMKPEDLDEPAKLNMGFIEFPTLPSDATVGQKKALELHHHILGFLNK
ncbi:uncharacterized protein B0P05DRAFT_559693 [Gilbertella persicaria]|uniref:uncharacterized protein n=1 Tax=Gilbertella persicaria TaxID=101096 RepID=UPI0022207AB7|nr:uncharacterized protein B0P05DRAFT_559693 [Gilbertella persicaria]KAI8057548.1 hypothetical protein B0P05DRAFT_559693 [Gilbertella persicaria]